MDAAFLLVQLVLVNIVLSGDNAVVIALASRNLPHLQRRKAVLYGSAGAIVLRVLFTLVAVWLLAIPYVQIVGGLLLVWIAFALLIEDDADDGVHSHDTLMAAVKTILIADIVMSLDNTLALAAIAKSNYAVLIFGLILSVPLIVFGSQVILKMIERFPIIVYGGAGLIAWTAGEMIAHDQRLGVVIHEIVAMVLPASVTLLVLGSGWWFNKRHGRTARDVLISDEHAAGRLADRID